MMLFQTLKSFFLLNKKVASECRGKLYSPPNLLDLSKSPKFSEYQILRGETILPSGEIAKSLFIDYIADERYALAKMTKWSTELYQDKVLRMECNIGKQKKNEKQEKSKKLKEIQEPWLMCQSLN